MQQIKKKISFFFLLLFFLFHKQKCYESSVYFRETNSSCFQSSLTTGIRGWGDKKRVRGRKKKKKKRKIKDFDFLTRAHTQLLENFAFPKQIVPFFLCKAYDCFLFMVNLLNQQRTGFFFSLVKTRLTVFQLHICPAINVTTIVSKAVIYSVIKIGLLNPQ